MGRFKAEGVIVRELDEIAIVFWDSQSIYVYPSGHKKGVIFHRWFAERGSYRYWHDFRIRMLQRRHLTYLACFELAAQYDIVATLTDERLDLSKVKVIKRD